MPVAAPVPPAQVGNEPPPTIDRPDAGASSLKTKFCNADSIGIGLPL